VDLNEHALLSACGAACLWAATGDRTAAVAFWAAGTLIDTDHLLDYWRDDGFNLNLPRFFRYFPERGPRYLFLAFHGWEWPILLAGAAGVTRAPLWIWAVAAAWLVHLGLDQRYNFRQMPACYFFAYRWSRGFLAADFYEQDGKES
jgi:hypothetical protein